MAICLVYAVLFRTRGYQLQAFDHRPRQVAHFQVEPRAAVRQGVVKIEGENLHVKSFQQPLNTSWRWSKHTPIRSGFDQVVTGLAGCAAATGSSWAPMAWRKALTTRGSNCVPAWRRISSIATRADIAVRYGRSDVIASNVSATAITRDP